MCSVTSIRISSGTLLHHCGLRKSWSAAPKKSPSNSSRPLRSDVVHVRTRSNARSLDVPRVCHSRSRVRLPLVSAIGSSRPMYCSSGRVADGGYVNIPDRGERPQGEAGPPGPRGAADGVGLAGAASAWATGGRRRAASSAGLTSRKCSSWPTTGRRRSLPAGADARPRPGNVAGRGLAGRPDKDRIATSDARVARVRLQGTVSRRGMAWRGGA